MIPTLFKIGPVPIHSYGLMMALAFLVALYFARRDAPKFGLDPDQVSDCAFWTLVLGLVGTRVLYVIMFHDQFSWSRPLEWFAIWNGGLVFQGGIPPALIFVYYYTRKHHIRFWNLLDMTAPYAALAHGIGRIGCFLNGCCYGKRTDLPWGVSFPRVPFDTTKPYVGSPVYVDQAMRYGFDTSVDKWSYPVHPTQLYSAFGLWIMCIILLYLRKHWRPFHGSIFAAYFMLYGVFRFGVEMLRGDHNPVHILGITDQQWFAIAAIIIGALLFAVLRKLDVGKDWVPPEQS